MEINAQEIKRLRLQKGWTQQHLAEACAVSLRTVQRVEKFGTASPETMMGLCAVFEISQDQLVIKPPAKPDVLTSISLYEQPQVIALVAVFGGFIGAFIMYLVMSL